MWFSDKVFPCRLMKFSNVELCSTNTLNYSLSSNSGSSLSSNSGSSNSRRSNSSGEAGVTLVNIPYSCNPDY